MVISANFHSVSAFKALTHRLASTPTIQLPRYVAQLSASLWMCRDILTTPVDGLKRGTAADAADLAVIVHRFRTQLTSLLQDRTVEGRWAAVVLTKAAIEAGGFEVLSRSNAWVRSLLAILKRSDPPSTRAFTVLVLTRIFMLTWDHVSLVREITTPALPSFVATCLSNATNKQCSANELLNILEAFELLLPHHPTIFRTNEPVLRALLLRIISSSDPDNDLSYTSQHVCCAQRLLSNLPFVLPKQGGSEAWEANLLATVDDAHSTCDRVFHPIIEAGGRSSKAGLTAIASAEYDKSGLPPWSGLHAGVERLITLLKNLEAYFKTATPSVVNLRLGSILELLDRIFSALPPGLDKHKLVKPNPESPKEQRDLLIVSLPAIHIAAFDLVSRIVERLGAVSSPFLSSCSEHSADVFAVESFDTDLRAAVYKLVSQILEIHGLSMSKDEVSQLTSMLQQACRDLLPETKPSPTQSDLLLPSDVQRKPTSDRLSEATSLSTPSSLDSNTFSQLQPPASAVLVSALSRLDPRLMPRALRTQIDRTAVLTQNKHALLASVLNPAPGPAGNALQTSLLPLLARLFPNEPELEALIRPRMPVIHTGKGDAGDDEEDLLVHADDGAEETTAEQHDDSLETDQLSHAIDDDPIPTSAHPRQPEQDQAAAFGTFVSNMQNKRPLPSDADADTNQKRLRPAAASDTARVVSEPAAVLQPHTAVTQSANTEPLSEAEDNSDIELPELTLEQDTDDEDD